MAPHYLFPSGSRIGLIGLIRPIGPQLVVLLTCCLVDLKIFRRKILFFWEK